MDFKTDALVLKTVDYKDSDKLLTLFSPERGKLTAGIRGVKKPNAKLSFCAQPFAFSEYVLAEKNGRYTVTGAYAYDGFYPLRTDIVRYYAANAVLEISDSLLVEEGENRALFIAAIDALKRLAYTDDDAAEALLSFALAALRESGYMIDLGGCGICGERIGKTPYFDFEKGYFTCGECAVGVRASPATYAVLRKCAYLTFDEKISSDANRRALKLIRTYLSEKTEELFPCFGEFIRLYE